MSILHANIEAQVTSPTLQLASVSYRYPNGYNAAIGIELLLSTGILGLLEPNGAGKSALMRMLATFTEPSDGKIFWTDVDTASDPKALRRTLGYLPQEFGVRPALSAREFLHYFAAVKGMSHAATATRVDECLDLVGLAAEIDKRLAEFSRGMRQHVGIAQALLNNQQRLIVDEPAAGLDPEERLRLRSVITELTDQRLVILSTHIAPDIEASATMLSIMNNGKLCFLDTSEALISCAQGRIWGGAVKIESLPHLCNRQMHVHPNYSFVLWRTIAMDGVAVLIVESKPLSMIAMHLLTLPSAVIILRLMWPRLHYV